MSRLVLAAAGARPGRRIPQYVVPAAEPLAQSPPQPGHTHLAFHTDDIEALHRRLIDHGFMPTSAAVTLIDPGSEWDGARAFYATDPDGRTIELVSFPRE